MQASEKAIELIKEFEDFSSVPYKCAAGIPTIGYGTTRYPSGKRVTMDDEPITEEQAVEFVMFHVINEIIPILIKYIKISLTQNQIDAIVSWVYNLGITNFKESTLLKKINLNAPIDLVKREWMKWVRLGGKILGGLIRRRNKEFSLYSKKEDGND